MAWDLLFHLYDEYRAIDEIDLLETNQVTMMKPYDPETPLALLVEQLHPQCHHSCCGFRGYEAE
eukprot:scaffold66137_cov65-Attheya_sp.AAC.1